MHHCSDTGCQCYRTAAAASSIRAGPNGSGAGCGVFKTTDGGETWQNLGLTGTHTVPRIRIHPENPDIAYVAGGGHEWTRNEERGLSIAQRLKTGMAHINDSSVNDEPHVPFGGIGASGVGRHGGKPGIDTFTELRWVTLERGGRHYPPPFLMKP